MRSWEPQMRYFSRRYRCICFNARGYPPSQVPESLESYTQERAALDIGAVLDHLGLARAHVVGLSMGGFATLHFGLIAPTRAISLVVAGAGYGAEKQHETYFRDVSLEVAAQFEAQGSETFSRTYALAASRGARTPERISCSSVCWMLRAWVCGSVTRGLFSCANASSVAMRCPCETESCIRIGRIWNT